MINFITAIFWLLSHRLGTVNAGCAHVYWYPIDECFGEATVYGGQSFGRSWIIACDSTTNMFTVDFYNNGKCRGEINETWTFAQGEDICSGENACSCTTDANCNIFEFENDIECPVDGGGPLVSTAKMQSKYSIVMDECIGWNDWNQTYYQKWVCNSNWTEDSELTFFDEDELPITLTYYKDDQCTKSVDSWWELFYNNSNYDSYDGGSESEHCWWESHTDCNYQVVAEGNEDKCSHFLHYPVGECATGFDYIYHLVDGFEVQVKESVSSNNNNNRRRLSSWDSSGEFICTSDGNGGYTYLHKSYGTGDCTGKVEEETDVTEYCKLDGYCNCNLAGGATEGDSSKCNIAFDGWSYTCDGNRRDNHELVVTDLCLHNESYICMHGEMDRVEWQDETCSTTQWSRCWNGYEDDCEPFTAPANAQCGYYSDYGSKYALGVCYGSMNNYTSQWGSQNYWIESKMYECDGNGNFSLKYYNESADCSGFYREEDITSKCDWLNTECVCGDGRACNIARRQYNSLCIGDNYRDEDYRDEYEWLEECEKDKVIYEQQECLVNDFGKNYITHVQYNNAQCTNVREECDYKSPLSRDVITTNCTYAPDGSQCGYLDDNALNYCYADDYESYMVTCDSTNTFWRQRYTDLECTTKDGDKYNVTDWCQHNYCECVVDSKCSLYVEQEYDPCWKTTDTHTVVLGVCTESYWGGYQQYTCEWDDYWEEYDYDREEYTDDQCQVKEYSSDSYDNSYDGSSDSGDGMEECTIDVYYAADSCGVEGIIQVGPGFDPTGSGPETDGVNSLWTTIALVCAFCMASWIM